MTCFNKLLVKAKTRVLLAYFVLYLALIAELLFLPNVWACTPSYRDFERPQCKETELHYGMCFNPNMAEAVKLTRSLSYINEFNGVIRKANSYLDTIEPSPAKVVLADLDETLVDNTGYYERYRVFDNETWQLWLKENSVSGGSYFVESLDLIKKAKEKGFSVMFVTGRPAGQATDTLRQFSAISWDGMFFRPQGKAVSSKEYKAQAREMLRKIGYTIVLNLGDQYSDFDLPVNSAEGEFLLPNIMYFSP